MAIATNALSLPSSVGAACLLVVSSKAKRFGPMMQRIVSATCLLVLTRPHEKFATKQRNFF